MITNFACRNLRLAILAFGAFALSRSSTAQDCVSATNTVRQYIALMEQLADNGFTEEKGLKRLSELVDESRRHQNSGYFIYTSQIIESCTTLSDREAKVVVRYRLAGQVRFNPKTPRKLPNFYKLSGSKRVLLRLVDGKIDLGLTMPLYPPVVAIQDYQDRMLLAGAHRSEQYRTTLDYLEKQQKTYLEVANDRSK